jgi:hypothetical protein
MCVLFTTLHFQTKQADIRVLQLRHTSNILHDQQMKHSGGSQTTKKKGLCSMFARKISSLNERTSFTQHGCKNIQDRDKLPHPQSL